MGFVEEFPADYEVPGLVVFLVREGAIEDLSSGNDVSPSFGRFFPDGNPTVRLWVDHPLSGHRQYPGARRFRVDVAPDGQHVEASFEYDELQDALGVLFRELGKAWRGRPHDGAWEAPDEYLEDLVAAWVGNLR